MRRTLKLTSGLDAGHEHALRGYMRLARSEFDSRKGGDIPGYGAELIGRAVSRKREHDTDSWCLCGVGGCCVDGVSEVTECELYPGNVGSLNMIVVESKSTSGDEEFVITPRSIETCAAIPSDTCFILCHRRGGSQQGGELCPREILDRGYRGQVTASPAANG